MVSKENPCESCIPRDCRASHVELHQPTIQYLHTQFEVGCINFGFTPKGTSVYLYVRHRYRPRMRVVIGVQGVHIKMVFLGWANKIPLKSHRELRE
jgi:hypothetical protein